MGFDALSWAFKQKTKAKLVLVALCESANDETGECWPGLQRIADRCDLTLRSARRAVAQLAKEGLIEISPRYRDDGTQTSNTYQVCHRPPTLPNLSTYPDTHVRETRTPTSGHEPISEPSEETPIVPRATTLTLTPYTLEFETYFWQPYPRKTGKGDAFKAWQKLKPTPEIQEKIRTAIVNVRGSPDWLKDGGNFIPHPTTWLNGRRWDNEIRQVSRRPGGVVL